MKIKQWDGRIQSYLDSDRQGAGIIVMVTKSEALRIIKSLIDQIYKNDPNYQQFEEFIPKGYEFFSIGIVEGNICEDNLASRYHDFYHQKHQHHDDCDDDINDDDICDGCNEEYDDCSCDDIDCINCGLDANTCGCWDGESWRSLGYTSTCEENIIDTFRPMNAFTRARWLKTQERI